MTARLITVAPTLLFVGDLAAIGVWAIVRSIRSGRSRIPAAPDNQPGTNVRDLWTCRRINALPSTSRKEKPKP